MVLSSRGKPTPATLHCNIPKVVISNNLPVILSHTPIHFSLCSPSAARPCGSWRAVRPGQKGWWFLFWVWWSSGCHSRRSWTKSGLTLIYTLKNSNLIGIKFSDSKSNIGYRCQVLGSYGWCGSEKNEKIRLGRSKPATVISDLSL